jgi:hypothetical protein
LEAADAANLKPRLLVCISGGMASIHSSSEIDLTVVDTDLEVRCENVFRLCSPEELDQLSRRFASYRYDRFFCDALSSAD